MRGLSMESKLGDFVYAARNLLDALNDRYDLFEKDEEMVDIIDEAQKCLEKLDYDESELD